MARIVAGFASSFSPQLHVPAEMWAAMGERDKNARALVGPDGKSHSYDELKAMAPEDVAMAMRPEEQQARHKRTQDGIAAVGKKLRETELDALIVLVDDEHSLFDDDNWPSALLYYGETVPYLPRPTAENAPPQTRAGAWAYGTEPLQLPGAPELGEHVLRHLNQNDIELSRAKDLKGRGIGHHMGFTNTRLLENKRLPLLPIVLNGSYPPNVPSPRRAFHIGDSVREAVRSWGSNDTRIGVLAVGGFSHPVIDEEMDRRILESCEKNDVESLCSIPRERLQGGSGQSIVWLVAAGALQDLVCTPVDYVAAYRSEGGTGCGMGFATWG